MAGNVMPSPVFTGFSDSGLIISGGKLYSYAAGTSTPQDTYTTSALSTPNANPVVMDSAGRAVVFLNQALSYKFVFKTAADVTLWTVDNATTLIGAGTVTLAMMADLAQDQFIGRTTASTGVPQTATITTAARTVLDDTTVANMVVTLGGGGAGSGTGGLVRVAAPTFTAQPATSIGSGSAVGNIPAMLNTQYTSVGTGIGTFENLMTYALPANTLSANGKGFRITAWGKLAANANAKVIWANLGGAYESMYASTGNALDWVVEVVVVRMTSTTGTSFASISIDGIAAAPAVFTGGGLGDYTTILTIGMACDVIAASDVLQYGMLVEAF